MSDNFEIIESKFSVHDRHRFEIKLDVDLVAGRKNSYRIESFFFIPAALNINPSTYNKDAFYNNSQKYIRFKTPQMSLDKIVDDTLESSPLIRTQKLISTVLAGTGDPETIQSLFDEIKLTGCVARASIRNYANFLIKEICDIKASHADSASKITTLKEHGESFTATLKLFVKKVRSMRMDICNPAVPHKAREAFLFFDEFTSLVIVEYMSNVLDCIRKNSIGDNALGGLDTELCAIINAQNEYRRTMGYLSIIRPGTDNAQIVYRRSVLKKFVSSVLHLKISTSEWEGAFQFFFGIAAGVAMLFAALVMILAQRRYASDSLAFMLIVVISYIFKDRIKDWLKLWFIKHWTSWIADRQTKIRDQHTGQNIGTFKEAFSFVSHKKLPPEILNRRNHDNITSIDGEGKPERVMKYEKEVELYPDSIAKFHQRRKDLNDIFRFNVMPLLTQADDPRVEYLHLDPQDNTLRTIDCLRVYHINVITKYSTLDSHKKWQTSFERMRLVTTRKGLLRIDRVPVS